MPGKEEGYYDPSDNHYRAPTSNAACLIAGMGIKDESPESLSTAKVNCTQLVS